MRRLEPNSGTFHVRHRLSQWRSAHLEYFCYINAVAGQTRWIRQLVACLQHTPSQLHLDLGPQTEYSAGQQRFGQLLSVETPRFSEDAACSLSRRTIPFSTSQALATHADPRHRSDSCSIHGLYLEAGGIWHLCIVVVFIFEARYILTVIGCRKEYIPHVDAISFVNHALCDSRFT